MYPLNSEEGFTLFEMVIVLMLISAVALAGMGTAQQYKLISEKTKTEGDLRVIARGLQDNWLSGTACNGTMPSGLPTQSPYGTTYNVNCYRNGIGVTVDLPAQVAPMMNYPNQVLTVVNASTTRLSVCYPAPFISDGGYVKRYVYLQ